MSHCEWSLQVLWINNSPHHFHAHGRRLQSSTYLETKTVKSYFYLLPKLCHNYHVEMNDAEWIPNWIFTARSYSLNKSHFDEKGLEGLLYHESARRLTCYQISKLRWWNVNDCKHIHRNNEILSCLIVMPWEFHLP